MMLSNLSVQFEGYILYESIYVEFLIGNRHLLSQCPRGVLVSMGHSSSNQRSQSPMDPCMEPRTTVGYAVIMY